MSSSIYHCVRVLQSNPTALVARPFARKLVTRSYHVLRPQKTTTTNLYNVQRSSARHELLSNFRIQKSFQEASRQIATTLRHLRGQRLRQVRQWYRQIVDDFRTLLNQERPPDGFGKFYPKGAKSTEQGKSTPDGKSQPKQQPKQETEFEFKFSFELPKKSGTGGGGGGPKGPSDFNMWGMLGFLGTISALFMLSFVKMRYQEITWKDFINNYLSKGMIDKLEVVNKKWVKVKFMPGSSVGTNAILWFNIGSVDTFERNLENIQAEMGIEPMNYIPVVYRNEIDSASLLSFIPTLMIIGLILWSMRRASNVMGGRGKGGGIFGMGESTAKLINPKDIPVKFK